MELRPASNGLASWREHPCHSQPRLSRHPAPIASKRTFLFQRQTVPSSALSRCEPHRHRAFPLASLRRRPRARLVPSRRFAVSARTGSRPDRFFPPAKSNPPPQLCFRSVLLAPLRPFWQGELLPPTSSDAEEQE